MENVERAIGSRIERMQSMAAGPSQMFCVNVYAAFVQRHLRHGRCERHNVPLRQCGCDPMLWLDREHAERMDLRRAGAYGRLLRMRQNRAFLEWLNSES